MKNTRTHFVLEMSSRRLNLVLLGLPGSGKGTQGKWMARDFGLNLISTGDLLRGILRDQSSSALAQQIRKDMHNGGLVGDATIIQIFENGVEALPPLNGWILDGFPRTLGQAQALDQWLTKRNEKLSGVLHIDVPRKIIWEDRIRDRRVHPASGRVYHLQFNPPKTPMVDDITGEPLIIRDDDKEDVVNARFDAYERMTAPLIRFYHEKNLLTIIPSPTSKIGYETASKVVNELKHRH